MIEIMQYVMYIVALTTAGFSLYYSIKARRSAEKIARGLYDARKNIAMGAMLLCFGSIQVFLHEFDSWIRIGVGFVFLLIGCFNLFAGIRNHAYFSRG